jgi:hypothetical protein
LYPEGEHPEISGAADCQIVQNVHNLKKGCIALFIIRNICVGKTIMLLKVRNNSVDNEPRDVSAVGNVGGDHAINNNNHCVALVNNIGDTEVIHDSCGTGPDVHVDNQLGMVEVVGDIDNGSPSPSLDNGFEIGRLNNIEPQVCCHWERWWWSFDQ